MEKMNCELEEEAEIFIFRSLKDDYENGYDIQTLK